MRPTSHKIELDKQRDALIASGAYMSAYTASMGYEYACDHSKTVLKQVSKILESELGYAEINALFQMAKLQLRVINKYETYEDELIEIINGLSLDDELKIKLIMSI